MSSRVRVSVTVNGRAYERDAPARMLLADFLRGTLGLTGTHVGCEHGVCGACTVLIDGVSVRSCLTFAAQCEGAEIVTVEGLGDVLELSALQEAFRKHHALQCGFCTPGMLMTIMDLLNQGRSLSEEAIRDALSGNLCRCTGYEPIVAAVLEIARQAPERGEGE